MLINFDAGPAALPQSVLAQAAQAVINYNNSGLSILEIAHRGPLFAEILQEANALVKDLLDLSNEYEILWLQGGGRLQFAMVPMNFLASDEHAGYIDSGHWAQEAIKNATFYGNAKILASSRENNYQFIPKYQEADESELEYLHITTNNTIYGTQFKEIPTTTLPLIADMSSELFSRKLNYSQFDLIYAVAQKNIGPAGVTLVIVRKSLLEKQKKNLPEILSYRDIAKHGSLLNTPPVFAIYTSLLTLRWINEQGLDNLEKENNRKAQLLYQTIDESPLFYGVAEPSSRSLMNICFKAYEEQVTSKFIEFALQHGITGIKGHRSVGGFRASLYNAISYNHVEQLVRLIKEFEQIHG